MSDIIRLIAAASLTSAALATAGRPRPPAQAPTGDGRTTPAATLSATAEIAAPRC